MDHPLFKTINDMLTRLGYPVSNINQPDYIAARLAEDPAYPVNPHDRIDFGSSYAETGMNGWSAIAFNEQWVASWSCKESYGILDLRITLFDGPTFPTNPPGKRAPGTELVRLELNLVEGEDALDNDEFNDFGWVRKLLYVELPIDRPVLPILETYLSEFTSSPHFPED